VSSPSDPDDLLPAGGPDGSYERIFADLFRRFWRGSEVAPAAPVAPAASPDPATED
jgi:hypothetical protein